MPTERKPYGSWKEAAVKLQKEVAELKARPEVHDETIEYLLGTADVLAKAAQSLCEMRIETHH